MATHDAVTFIAPRGPLKIQQVPTIKPAEGQIRLKVLYAASTPLDLHRADGGLLMRANEVMGSGYAGEVVEVGAGVTNFAVGDKAFGFGFPSEGIYAAGHQIYVTIPWHFAGKLPAGLTLQEAVTTTGSVVTIFHAMVEDYGLDLPWPIPENYVPQHANDPILLWGGSGSVGLYAIQVLRHWGYRNLIATASKRNHALLLDLGATQVFDYNEPDVVEKISAAAGPAGPRFVLDCIGHATGTVEPISKIARKGSKVAIVLPVILRDATDHVAPEYAMDAAAVGTWAEGVQVTGVRAHSYEKSAQLKQYAQTYMVPQLLASGAIKPLPQRIVEGETLLDRATAALAILRNKGASAEKLVWRVAEN